MVVDIPFYRLLCCKGQCFFFFFFPPGFFNLLERLSSIFQDVNTLGFPCYELFVQTIG